MRKDNKIEWSTVAMAKPYFETDPCGVVLDELYIEAKRDKLKVLPRLPWFLVRRIFGREFSQIFKTSDFSNVYMPVDREEGKFLYRVARARRPKLIVEFGSSYGISAVFLGSALKDQGFGQMIGTEIEHAKVVASQTNIRKAGLEAQVSIREGDALQTLRDLNSPIDILFLDGWKDLYLPLVKMLLPKLDSGAVLLSDNMQTFRRELVSFREFLLSLEGGFSSLTVPLGDGIEFAVKI